MKKLIKLSTDHYIKVDNELEITVGDWYYLPRTNSVYQCKEDPTELNLERDFGVAKITHSTQPLESMNHGNYSSNVYLDIEKLSLQEVKELISEVDVEKKADEFLANELQAASPSVNRQVKLGFESGYNQCLEDNKDRKYTEENVLMVLQKTARKYFKEGREYKGNMAIAGDPLHGLRSELREYLQSLQPKTEGEVEIVDGKLKLKQ